MEFHRGTASADSLHKGPADVKQTRYLRANRHENGPTSSANRAKNADLPIAVRLKLADAFRLSVHGIDASSGDFAVTPHREAMCQSERVQLSPPNSDIRCTTTVAGPSSATAHIGRQSC